MDWFKLIYTLLGGLGLFFFGMTQLSESLQSMAGDIIKKIIKLLTTNRIMAVGVGLMITMIVQSSSITTVMVVSFVNAGLMNLTQAIGVIFGSNIGTTITGWIIAIKIGKYGLALLGVGIFPMLFVKDEKIRNIGKLIFALGLVFFGLQLMSSAFKPLRGHDGFLALLTYFQADSIGSILACVGIGAVLTMVIQSSSAMLGITIAMAGTGIISFQTSVALILGENIGTTITALLASISGNVNAKRAARSHTVFNVTGVLIILLMFYPYVNFIEWLIGGVSDFTNAEGGKPYIAAHIAAAHTVFNLTATILCIPLLGQLAKIVIWITPEKKHKESHKLTYLGEQTVPELAIEEAFQELKKMSGLVRSTILETQKVLSSDEVLKDSAKRVVKYESITDNMHTEIFVFLSKVLRSNVTENQALLANQIIRASDELESIADYCESLVRYNERLQDSNSKLSQSRGELLSHFVNDTLAFYDYVDKVLSEPETFNLTKCKNTYISLNNEADEIRTQHLNTTIEEGESPLTLLTFSDMIVALRRIKNHAINMAEAVTGQKVNI